MLEFQKIARQRNEQYAEKLKQRYKADIHCLGYEGILIYHKDFYISTNEYADDRYWLDVSYKHRTVYMSFCHNREGITLEQVYLKLDKYLPIIRFKQEAMDLGE